MSYDTNDNMILKTWQSSLGFCIKNTDINLFRHGGTCLENIRTIWGSTGKWRHSRGGDKREGREEFPKTIMDNRLNHLFFRVGLSNLSVNFLPRMMWFSACRFPALPIWYYTYWMAKKSKIRYVDISYGKPKIIK